jgi:hypothetical protein
LPDLFRDYQSDHEEVERHQGQATASALIRRPRASGDPYLIRCAQRNSCAITKQRDFHPANCHTTFREPVGGDAGETIAFPALGPPRPRQYPRAWHARGPHRERGLRSVRGLPPAAGHRRPSTTRPSSASDSTRRCNGRRHGRQVRRPSGGAS